MVFFHQDFKEYFRIKGKYTFKWLSFFILLAVLAFMLCYKMGWYPKKTPAKPKYNVNVVPYDWKPSTTTKGNATITTKVVDRVVKVPDETRVKELESQIKTLEKQRQKELETSTKNTTAMTQEVERLTQELQEKNEELVELKNNHVEVVEVIKYVEIPSTTESQKEVIYVNVPGEKEIITQEKIKVIAAPPIDTETITKLQNEKTQLEQIKVVDNTKINQLETQLAQAQSELTAEKNKPPQIVEKVVYQDKEVKIVDNTKINQLETQLAQAQNELRVKAEELTKLQNEKTQLEQGEAKQAGFTLQDLSELDI